MTTIQYVSNIELWNLKEDRLSMHENPVDLGEIMFLGISS